MTSIFFDESGFTGNNPLDEVQTVFVFAGVAIDEADARQILDPLLSAHRPQGYGNPGYEPKGRVLKKTARGRKLLEDILKATKDKARVFCADKKFGLAIHMFEYLFEPVVARKSLLFYERNFHRYVAGMLHAGFATSQRGAEQFFQDFKSFLKARDAETAPAVFEVSAAQSGDFFGDINRFAVAHRSKIQAQFEEPTDETESEAEKWLLDLSFVALHTLLLEFGREHDSLAPICDPSKPLAATVSMLDTMVNSGPQRTATILGEDRPLSYNLASSVDFRESHRSAGIQLADLVAAAVGYSIQANNEEARRWGQDYVMEMLSGNSLLPDYAYCDPNTGAGVMGMALLQWLVEKSNEGADPLQGIEFYIAYVEKQLAESTTASPG